MNGHVFQCNYESNDKQQFSKTIEALAEYIAKNIKYAKDVASLCKTGKLIPIKEPADLSVEDKKSETKVLIWKSTVQSYVTRCEMQDARVESTRDIRGHVGPGQHYNASKAPILGRF
jgi:hypothetical protein